ncbi:DUF885 domain-containing protein [Microbulbifer yueqingensis]|uniref:Uncharacterized conserved protein, DUF885 familyt n=1 Tax=Microbulbifer yueqingensis TaxID=658219 RepID=A0A1G8XYZ6_9GAMM|nr:DUF885 domain-containing protein [Microbulbifer yueqingensis]SDJ95434.1 Uncharacterized conserved protein, DUF885 familyt [Microbulbifer yueqingensis]
MSLFHKSLLAAISFCAATGAAAMEERAFNEAFAELPSEGAVAQLKGLQDLRYRWLMESYPSSATYRGYPGVDDRWTDQSLEGIKRRREQTRRLLAASRQLDETGLPEELQLDYQLLYQDLLTEVKGFQFPDHLMPVTHMSGLPGEVPSTLNAMSKRTGADYENILARLEKLPLLVQQTRELMARGLEQGITPPQITLRDLPAQIRALVPENPDESPLLKAFTEMTGNMSASQQQRLKKRAHAIYRSELVPALRVMAEFVEREYIPGAVTETAFTSRPDGLRWYAHKVRENTTTSLSPEEIHRIGLREVKRIRGEMEQIIAETGFDGDFAEFTEFLRTDPRFFHDSRDALMRDYRDIAKRIDGELPKLFGKLPRLPYGVKRIPTYLEKSATTAYYMPGSIEAGRAGVFFANTYALDSRPKWEMEALTVHEAMPGHHLQIALAQELEGVHPLRRVGGYTAFVEGWGLYSESLGHDLGMYQDPYSRFGALTYDMWRAVRLVVDTGMHQLGWSREEAIEYFMANSAKPRHDVTVEIDRYLVWPGQALAYKLGQLKIMALRAAAEEELGDGFDIRAFHDQLLGAGAVPLNVLESRMNAWLETRSTQAAASTSPAWDSGEATPN